MLALRSKRAPVTASSTAGEELVALLRQIVSACGGELVRTGEGTYELHMPEPWDLYNLHRVGSLVRRKDGWAFTPSGEWLEVRKELL